MTERPTETFFTYDHCDVPEGMSLAEWRSECSRRDLQGRPAGGVFAAVAARVPFRSPPRGDRPS